MGGSIVKPKKLKQDNADNNNINSAIHKSVLSFGNSPFSNSYKASKKNALSTSSIHLNDESDNQDGGDRQQTNENSSALPSINYKPNPTENPHNNLENQDDGSRLNTGISSTFSQIREESINPVTSIHWKKGELIGSGQFGKVYMGLDEDAGSLMATKEILFGDSEADEINAICSEVELLRSLNHENIVKYLGAECQDKTLYVFMEWVPGGSLLQLQRKFGVFSEKVVRKYTFQLLQGLAYLHDNHVIHRDIKSANILVDDRGNIKLSDFGASRIVLESSSGASHMQSLRGTPYYMAPEVILQSGYGRKADIWSVGCTVLQLLTGSPPWKDMKFESSAALLYHIAQSKSTPTIPSMLSTDANSFITSCLQRDPKQRCSAHELLQHPFVSPVQSLQTPNDSISSSIIPLPYEEAIVRTKEKNIKTKFHEKEVIKELTLTEATLNDDRGEETSENGSILRSSSAWLMTVDTSLLTSQDSNISSPIERREYPLGPIKNRSGSPIRNSKIDLHDEKPIITNVAMKEKQKELEKMSEQERKKKASKLQWEAELARELAYQRLASIQ